MPVKVITFGCRINAYESALIKDIRSTISDEVIVVNTCAVTGEAERQARQAIRKLRRENPRAFIIAAGCAAQVHPEVFAAMPEVNRVLGNQEKLKDIFFTPAKPRLNVGDISSCREFSSHLVSGFEGKSRGFLQIQQGCDYACTFCIVPQARGKNRSVPPATILTEARNLIASGFKELVLSGVNIASYGNDNPSYGNLASLARLILQETQGLKRLRLSSMDLGACDTDIIELFATSPVLMPHLHLSLQSGSNMILKRMGRRHSRKDVFSLCQKLREVRPDIVIGADFITGFPTENEAMFADTMTLAEECQIALLHVFPYSEREGTPAAKMPQIPVSVRRERARKLRTLGQNILKTTLSEQQGKIQPILIETTASGFSPHYLHTEVKADSDLIGNIVNVRITGHTEETLKGEIVS